MDGEDVSKGGWTKVGKGGESCRMSVGLPGFEEKRRREFVRANQAPHDDRAGPFARDRGRMDVDLELS